MTGTAAHKDLVLRLYEEGLNQGRYRDIIQHLVAADAVTHDGLQSGGAGPEAVIATMHALHHAFKDMTFIIDDLIAEDDRVAIRWHMTGRHVGPFAGQPATNRLVNQRAVVIYRIEDGQVAEVWPLIDRLGLLHQIAPGIPPGRPEVQPTSHPTVTNGE